MPDITPNEALNALGLNMSSQEFIEKLATTLLSKVGNAKPYGSQQNQEQKRMKENLDQMSKLTDEISSLNEILKKVHETAKAKKAARTSSPSNLESKMRTNTPLEIKTFEKLSKMADEAVTGHSLHVHDFTVVGRLDNLIGHVREIAKALSSNSGGGGGGSNRKSGRSPSSGDLGEAATLKEWGLDEEALGVAEEGLAEIRDSMDEVDNLMAKMAKKAKEWGTKLGLTEAEMMEILLLTQENHALNVEDLLLLEKTLNNYGKLNNFDKKRIENALYLLKIAKQKNATEEELTKQKSNLGKELLGAGHRNMYTALDNVADKLNRLNNFLSYLDPSKYGIGKSLDFDPSSAAKIGSELIQTVGQNVYQLSHEVGNILKKDVGTWQGTIFKVFEDMSQMATEQNEMLDAVRKIGFRALRRGITESKQIESLTRTSVSLGKQIGADTNQTAEELMDWVQRFNLSNVQARALSYNIQRVGMMTGVTGDNLLNAVKQAQSLAELMRQTGNMTEQANESLVRFSAVAQKLGTSQFARSFIEGLTSADSFLHRTDSGTQMLLRSFALSSSNPNFGMQGLLQGTTLNNAAQGRNLAGGAQSYLNQFLGGRRLEQLNDTERSNLDRIIRAQTEGRIGLGALADIVKTLQQTFETEQDKIDRLTKELQLNTNMSGSERKAIEEQIAQTKSALGNRLNLDALMAIRRRMGMSGSLAEGLTGTSRAEAEANIRAIATRAGMKNIDELIKEAFSSGSGFNEVLNKVTTALEKKQGKERAEADPVTKAINDLTAVQNSYTKWWQDQWKTFMGFMPSEAFAGVGIAIAIGSQLAQIIVLLATIRALSVLGGGSNALGAAAAAGKGGGLLGRLGGNSARILGILGLAKGAYDAYSTEGSLADKAAALFTGGSTATALGAGKNASNAENAGGVLQGAAIGSTFGPLGTVGGALISGGVELNKAYALLSTELSRHTGLIQKENKQIDEIILKREQDVKRISGGMGTYNPAELLNEIQILQKDISSQMENVRNKRKNAEDAASSLSFYNWTGGIMMGDKARTQKELEDAETILRKSQEVLKTKSEAMDMARRKRIGSLLPGSVDPNSPEAQKAIGTYQSAEDQLLQQRIRMNAYIKKFAFGETNPAGAESANKWREFMITNLGLASGKKFGDIDEALAGSTSKAFKTALETWQKENPTDLTPYGIEQATLLESLDTNFKEAGKAIQALSDAGLNPGSIYTHDMHLEPILLRIDDTLASTSANDSEEMIRHRIATEFAGTKTNESLTMANTVLSGIYENNQQQVELMKQELEVLKAILVSLSSSGTERGNTSPNTKKSTLPMYYNWSIRPLNSPNYGGIENHPRV